MTKTLVALVSTWALLGGVLLLLIVLVTTINVGAFSLDRVARLAGTNIPGLPGYEDFVRLLVGAAALMCFPYCQLRQGHVSVDLLASHLPECLQRWLQRLWLLCTVAVAVALAWYLFLGMQDRRADHALTPVLGWPEWPFYLPGILSLLLWALVALMQLLVNDDHG